MIIKEGRAIIRTSIDQREIFYNPRGRFTRSLGVAVVAAESSIKRRKIDVADVLAATGVRGIRYYLESDSVNVIFLNDISKSAYKLIRENLRVNRVERAEISCLDANLFLAQRFREKDKLDFIDIDPYGSPAPFIDLAVSAVKVDGLLAITSTDLAPLCGIYPWASFRKYGGKPFKDEFCHEMAARILIFALQQACGRRERFAETVLTCYSEHYLRIYARIRRGKKKFPKEDIGVMYRCLKCLEIFVRRIDNPLEKCPLCGSRLNVAGPLWIGNIHRKEFLEQVGKFVERVYEIKDRDRIRSFVKVAISENDYPPYHFDISRASKRLKVSSPSVNSVIEKLKSIGFRATRTHFNPTGIKTNAPYNELLKIIRELSIA